MADHPQHIVIINVSRAIGIGQDHVGVEDVEALVFHRSEIEIAYGHDVEDGQIIFAGVNILVPFHRKFQRFHCVMGFGKVSFRHPDRKFDMLAAHRGETVTICAKIACHQREQIGRLGERIIPFRPVLAALQIASAHGIAVAQQHGEGQLIRRHPHMIATEHIGPIREKGDAPEPFGLTLRAQNATRGIEAHQLFVGRRGYDDFRFHLVRFAAQLDNQVSVIHLPNSLGAIDLD